ncbi:unnamed protein product [Protopolystoma xenopodis]|uniref:Uncharacterized protein n=1 Tax=Protopolystoma xenopodis TaxID=117903 RepID=A0A3S5CM98_9PLAT|nr:unnamed protein product [Protopolystoma xenopodis]
MCTSLLMQGARRPANTRLGESYSIRGSTNTDSIAADEIPCLADGEFGSFSHLDYLSEAPIPPNVCDTSSTRQPGLRQSCVCLPSKNTEHSNTSPDLFASIEPRTNGIAPISNLNHLEGQHPRALVTLESVASGAGGKLSLSLSELTDRFSRSATSTLPLKHAVNPLSSSYTGLPNYVATTINVNGNVVGVTEKKPGDENLTELCLTNSLDGLIPRSGLSGGIMQTSNLFRLAEQQEANLRAHSGSWGRLNESLGSLGRQSTTLTKAEQRRTSAAVVGGGGGGDSSTKHLSTSTSTELRASGSVPVPSLALLVAQLQLDASAGGVPDEEGSGGSSHVRSLSGNCLVTSCANAVGGSWSRPSSRPESPSTIDMVGVGRSGTLPASTKDSSERHADLPETMVTSVLRGSFTLDKPTTLGLPEIGSPPLAYASLQISSQFLS